MLCVLSCAVRPASSMEAMQCRFISVCVRVCVRAHSPWLVCSFIGFARTRSDCRSVSPMFLCVCQHALLYCTVHRPLQLPQIVVGEKLTWHISNLPLLFDRI